MAKMLARLATLDISTDGGSNWTPIADMTSGTLSHEGEPADMSSHDSGGVREYEPDWESASLQAEFQYNEGDAGQEALFTSKGTKRDFRFRRKTESGVAKEETAEGVITGIEENSGDSGPATLSLSVQLSGAITRATQA